MGRRYTLGEITVYTDVKKKHECMYAYARDAKLC